MNSSDIKNFVFNKSALGGYKISDVKGCLNEISEYVSSLESKIYDLDSKNKSLKSQLYEFQKTQDEIKDIVASAQNFRHKILKEAEEQTNELILKAKEQAKKIEEEAERSSTEKIEEISKKIETKKTQLSKLKKEVSDFKVHLLETYKAHLDLITKLPEINENSSLNKDEIENNSNESSTYEDESEVFEKLQTKQKFNFNEESANYNNFKKNLSDNENIFQRKLVENSNQNYSNSMKNTDGYIKSRFDELKT